MIIAVIVPSDQSSSTSSSGSHSILNTESCPNSLEYSPGVTEVYFVISFWSLERMILSFSMNKELITSESILTDHPLVTQLFRKLLIEKISELLCFGITRKLKPVEKIALTKKLRKQLEEHEIPLKLLMMSKK